MTWTGQTFSVGQVLTAAQMTNLQADITALANGDSGAPSIAAAALGSAIVAQGHLNTSSGEVSTNTGTNITLPGGAYGFYPQQKVASYNATNTLSYQLTSTSYITNIRLVPGSTNYVYAQQRYINASPPYDLGFGEIPLFIFGLVDSLGNVKSMYVAQEAPWHHNGPTIIRPDFYVNGKGYMNLRAVEAELIQQGLTPQDIMKGTPTERATFLSRLLNDGFVPVEVTQSIKNKDMSLIPHPYLFNSAQDLAGLTPFVINPQLPIVQNLFELHMTGEASISELVADDYLRITNTPVDRGFDPSVTCISIGWRLS